MKICITGGLGYIGTTLIRHLQGHEIVVVDNLIFNQGKVLDKMADLEFRLIQEDVREHNEWYKYDAVIHLAAYVGMPICNKKDKVEVVSLNEKFTKDLTDRLSPAQLLLYPNTNSSYGASTDPICTENSKRNPLSLYALTKDRSEDTVLSKNNGMAFRLATVMGISPRMRFDLLVNDFCEIAYREKCLKIFEGGFRRNYVSVNDVARAFDFALENWGKVKGEVFNLGNDYANCTKLDLATAVAFEFGAACYEMPGEDADKRDYNVSSKKLYDLGFECKDSLINVIRQNKQWLENNEVKPWMRNV
jgi:nucleoside-diphosphate-sugar epimerase